ncbi:GlcG/HbpS family heme-binding protein [Pseudonocardia sp. CA-107938]|uniref:GlcG/HbpS family heme-binding protein n=1 Tax=Pseudonocardia sp. CA-107938 TaxID=3240021 RepID=UPI003D8BC9B0
MAVDRSEGRGELISAAHQRAAEIGARVTVAITDEGGHLQALGRMDGAPPLSARIAERKAASVALIRRDGAGLRTMQESWPALFDRFSEIAGGAVLAGAGSLLIRRGDVVVGAISVSGGDRPGQDDDVAEAALASDQAPAPVAS